MSRVNGKAPPAFVGGLNKIEIKDCYFSINPKEIPIGTSVIFRLKSGEKVAGKLTNHRDWLVGCAVVTADSGDMFGVYYDGDIIGRSEVMGEKK